MQQIITKTLLSGLKRSSSHHIHQCRRQLTMTQQTLCGTASYEGDGKTKVNILNRELELGLMINSYSQYGFRLNNDLKVVGPMAIFPR